VARVTTADEAVATAADADRGRQWGKVAVRLGAAAGAALFLGALKIHRPPQLATVCVLRGFTGVPCPLCGSTTAFVRLGQGRVADALLANPVVLLVALCLVLAPTGVFGALRRAPQRTVWAVVAVVTGASWLWQLSRYDYLL
jgi:hypothetical protein